MRQIYLFLSAIIVLTFINCSEDNNPISDADKTAALKNVAFTYDSMQYVFGLPEGALDGKTFAELLKLDSSKYANPANYGIQFIMTMNADNTSKDARDAKFDGMVVDIVMDTITSSPVELLAGPFEIPQNKEMLVEADGAINLATHRRTGLYIFRQAVDGNDLATTLATRLKYKFGLLTGEIPLPQFQKDIPTRMSEETKQFLRDVLESGILDEPQ